MQAGGSPVTIGTGITGITLADTVAGSENALTGRTVNTGNGKFTINAPEIIGTFSTVAGTVNPFAGSTVYAADCIFAVMAVSTRLTAFTMAVTIDSVIAGIIFTGTDITITAEMTFSTVITIVTDKIIGTSAFFGTVTYLIGSRTGIILETGSHSAAGTDSPLLITGFTETVTAAVTTDTVGTETAGTLFIICTEPRLFLLRQAAAKSTAIETISTFILLTAGKPAQAFKQIAALAFPALVIGCAFQTNTIAATKSFLAIVSGVTFRGTDAGITCRTFLAEPVGIAVSTDINNFRLFFFWIDTCRREG